MLKGLLCLMIMLTVASVAVAAQVIDIVFVIDTSGSISGAELALEIDGFQHAVDNLLLPAVDNGVTINIGVVCFSTDAQILLSLTPLNSGTVAAINAAIANATSCNRALTNFGDALNQAITVLAGGTAPRQVINLTSNGEPTTGPDPIPIADSFKATSGHEIWTVGVDVTAGGRTLMQTLAGPPPASYFEAADFADFERAENEKISQIIPPPPPGVEDCDNGIDDDGDGLIDCDDPDCAGDPACPPAPTIPTLSQWGMIILATLFVGTSVFWIVRRRRLAEGIKH